MRFLGVVSCSTFGCNCWINYKIFKCHLICGYVSCYPIRYGCRIICIKSDRIRFNYDTQFDRCMDGLTSRDWIINSCNDCIKEICIRGNKRAFYSIEMCYEAIIWVCALENPVLVLKKIQMQLRRVDWYRELCGLLLWKCVFVSREDGFDWSLDKKGFESLLWCAFTMWQKATQIIVIGEFRNRSAI